MIQVYADNVLAYDSRLEEYDLLGLKVTTGLNKGGTAEIVMPPLHPAYSYFTSYSTIVEIYRDQRLQFRGRALYPTDDYYNQRTVMCEGELCFFQDAVSRPYLYQDAPAAVFAAVVGVYNSQVEDVKKFKVGTVTVTDANDYIRLESETAESVMDTLNKLLERCGGYLIFTTDPEDGARVVNWYAEMTYHSGQVIEFDENLLDFSRSGANTSLITAVLPYGAKDEETGARATIESVNNGLDYIVDEDARKIRGFIIKAVYWDDVKEPANLLRKAQQYLEEHRYFISSLELSALDMSYMDKDIDIFLVGDNVHVRSKPHGVDEAFLLTERTEDLLNPSNSTITLGKDRSTLTDADVAGDAQNRGELNRVTHDIRRDFQIGVEEAVQQTELTLKSYIDQTSTNISTYVAETYVTNDQLQSEVSSQMTQTAAGFQFDFTNLEAKVDANDADARAHINEQRSYIRFENGVIYLGEDGNAMTLELDNDMIVFKKGGEQFGWWDGVDFHTGNIVVEVNERAQFGNFAFVPRSNGSLSFLKVGG